MKLYLCQHADALAKEEDPGRGLSPAGEEDAGKVARFLASSRIRVDKVLHSPKLRARRTAEILAEAIPAPLVEAASGLLPMDDPEAWARTLEGEDSDIMLVGHMPHWGGSPRFSWPGTGRGRWSGLPGARCYALKGTGGGRLPG